MQTQENNRSEQEAKAQLESIVEMVAAMKAAEEEDDDNVREEARERIKQGPLSVEVRSDWYTLGQDSDKSPSEYRILLSWGGPACQIVGDLDQYLEPDSARIEYQDWGTPWTPLRGISREEEEALISYARCFYGE